MVHVGIGSGGVRSELGIDRIELVGTEKILDDDSAVSVERLDDGDVTVAPSEARGSWGE